MPEQDGSQKSQKTEQTMEKVPQETEALVEVVLNHALEAEGNFLALYDVAIRKAQAGEAKEKLKEFRQDHETHIREIRGALEQLGGTAMLSELKPTPMAQAMAQRLEATGSDEELVGEFIASEDFSRNFYSWIGSLPLPEPVARIAQRGMDDEERHYAWAAKQLGMEIDEG